jgi:peptidyl-prolyl cis-trans isomerase D
MEIRNDEDNFKNYIIKQKTNNKNSILKSYDLFLNNKYKVNLNQKTIERIKNNF